MSPTNETASRAELAAEREALSAAIKRQDTEARQHHHARIVEIARDMHTVPLGALRLQRWKP